MAADGVVDLLDTPVLTPATRQAARCLVERAFDGSVSVEDWMKAPSAPYASPARRGPSHRGRPVVQRHLLHGGRTFRVGYVEAVAVHPELRRRGLPSSVMAALEGVVRTAYDGGALSATDDGAALHRARGWLPGQGSTWALTPEGRVRTPEDDDAVFVLPDAAELDPAGELTCDWRDGDLW